MLFRSGPVAAPQPFQPATFARNILEMLDVSVQQGWIESPLVARDLRSLLTDIAKALDRGDITQASKLLQSLLKRVEEEKERALLSEAYALLKFNCEFLQGQLNREQTHTR